MATFTVTTIADTINSSDGVLSLREAVTQANATAGADTIVFASAIQNQTLVLTAGELLVTRDLTVDGQVRISGNDGGRIFQTANAAVDLALNDLTLADGLVDGNGGAILLRGGDLSLNGCAVIGCAVLGGDSFTDYHAGGAIYGIPGSAITVTNSRIVDCEAGVIFGSYARGGAIAGGDLDVVIRSSSLSRNSTTGEYYSEGNGGAIALYDGSTLIVENSRLDGKGTSGLGNGGAIALRDSSAVINRSSITNSNGDRGGGVCSVGSYLFIGDSTVADNSIGTRTANGAGIYAGSSRVVVRNTTITGNENRANYSEFVGYGGGIFSSFDSTLDIANSIVAGNTAYDPVTFGIIASDIFGTITHSNGHNVFGSDVLGNAIGDRENVAPGTVFAAIDPATGGGLLNAAGIVPLRAGVTNPALGGADRFAIGAFDQLGVKRPAPTGTNPDIGAAESGFAHSKVASANNDTLTGTAAANTLNGLAGHDFLKGLGGNDTLNGGDGNDFLEGGAGNDRLNGGAGIDIANYGDSSARVVVDLRGNGPGGASTAKRGTETDTLTGIEGAIGGGGNDRFWGDGGPNWFQGGGGKDTFTGGAGRDLYDYNLTSASPAGAGRDVITDFAPGIDRIDLMGIDADASVAGNQAFRWVGKAALTGPGEVGYFTSGGNTIVRMSTDADAAAEAEIQLTGIKTLTALDFYL
jgi:Ca2+-binding RTX toxin-like protein